MDIAYKRFVQVKRAHLLSIHAHAKTCVPMHIYKFEYMHNEAPCVLIQLQYFTTAEAISSCVENDNEGIYSIYTKNTHKQHAHDSGLHGHENHGISV